MEITGVQKKALRSYANLGMVLNRTGCG